MEEEASKQHIYKCIHIMDSFSQSSGPLDRSRAIQKKYPTLIIAYFSSNENCYNSDIIGLGANSLWDINALNKLIKILKRYPSSIINTHHHKSGMVVRILKLLMILRHKLIHSFGNKFMSFKTSTKFAHIFTLWLVNVVVFVSESNYKSLRSYWKIFFPSNYKIIRNGINFNEIEENIPPLVTFDEKTTLGINMDGLPVITTVGRLIEQKDHETLLKAIQILDAQGIDVQLCIVGQGHLLSKFKERTVQYGISEKVIFTGFLPRKKVYQILHCSNIFVMTSKWEGLCVSLLQAMYCGLPVIVSNIPSFQEIVTNNQTGLIANCEDPESFADKIKSLLNDKEKALKLGEKGKEHVEINYSIRNTTSRYIDLYSEMRFSDGII